MNSFGRIFKITIFGESHGPYIGVTIDGVLPGLDICEKDFENDLKRRNPSSPYLTERKETDAPKIISGIFNGNTTGAPLTIIFENKNIDSSFYEMIKDIPRPSHADFASRIKYKGFNDYRGGGIFSARLTVAMVAAGVVAKKIINKINKNIKINSYIISLANTNYPSKEAEEILKKAKEEGNTVGGEIKTIITGLNPGIGQPLFDGVESYLSHILFAIPSIKAISFGQGFESSKMYGSDYIDVFLDSDGRTKTNNSGGINGGLTNGNDIIFTCYFRPPSSMKKEVETVNLRTNKKVNLPFEGRYDVAPILRAAVIVEAACAIGLVDLLLINNFLYK
ncbi:MAG: chorismate synthase [Exilispira sp.]